LHLVQHYNQLTIQFMIYGLLVAKIS